MDKKAYLKSFRLQQKIINRLEEMSVTNPDKIKTYRSQIKECDKKRNEIEKVINKVANELQREVLIQKYICGKTHEEIALSLNYSKRHIERIHSAALKNIKIYQKNT